MTKWSRDSAVSWVRDCDHDDFNLVLSTLRQGGLNAIDSIVVLREALGISLAEAKEMLINSAAWGDLRSQHEQLMLDFEAAIETETEAHGPLGLNPNES